MEYVKKGNTWLVRLDKGDEIVACLKAFATRESIKLAKVEGIGAVQHTVLGLFHPVEKRFIGNTFEEPLEVVALAGNLSTMEGEVYLHLHMAAADASARMVGGHLSEAVVSATAEITVTPLEGEADRAFDEDIGLNLLKF